MVSPFGRLLQHWVLLETPKNLQSSQLIFTLNQIQDAREVLEGFVLFQGLSAFFSAPENPQFSHIFVTLNEDTFGVYRILDLEFLSAKIDQSHTLIFLTQENNYDHYAR